MDINDKIIKAIQELEFNPFDPEVKKRLKYLDREGVKRIYAYDGFDIVDDTYCWVIWRHTSLAEQPQWKGEDVSKVIPCGVTHKDKILKILQNQDWMYW